MSSPFSIFRRHQKVLMVVITGLSMISFVLMGMVSDPRNLPLPMIVLFVACVIGGVAALAGMRSGNATEWGVTGLLMGIIFGLSFLFLSRTDQTAVWIKSGNLSYEDVSALRRQRSLANAFVQETFRNSMDASLMQFAGIEGFLNQMLSRYLFGFSGGEEPGTDDLVLGEIFRRKGHAMGMSISDDAVLEYIKSVASNKMTREMFTKIRDQLRVSETELMNAFKAEMLAKQVANLTVPGNQLPPETYWEFHRQLNVKQTAEIGAIPASAFVDAAAVPPRADLDDLFTRFARNFPGFDEAGKPAPGRPGFRQPRRMQLAYLEANRESLASSVEQPTDAEVEALYKSRYLRSIPSNDGLDELKLDGMPQIPPPSSDANPGAMPAPPVNPPSTDNPPAEAPPANNPPANPNPENPPAAAPPADRPMSSVNEARPATQPVAFYQENSPANPPAANAPPADAPQVPPTGEAPAVPAPPADAPAANPDMPKLDLPPAPANDTPAFDDDMKKDLRAELHNQKVAQEVRKRIADARKFMGELSYKVLLPSDHPEHMTYEAVVKKIEEYATQHSLRYVTAPLMTFNEMTKSEEFPVGQSIATLGQQSLPVADVMSMTSSGDLYRPGSSDLQTAVEMTSFAYWKIQDKASYIPENLDNEEIRNQVTEAWRLAKAQPLALARAEELAKQAREGGKPLAEALAEATVTGKAGEVFVDVRPTGEFSWMSVGLAPATSMTSPPPVRASEVNGVKDPGEEFFEMAFDKLKPGEIGVAPNEEHSVYYIIKVIERNPSNEEQLADLRSQFLLNRESTSFRPLAQNLLATYSSNNVQRIFEENEVTIAPEQNAPGAPVAAQ